MAKYLVGANLTGHDSHGVARTLRYVEWLDKGWLRAGQQLSVLNDSDVMALVDGQHGFGQTIGPAATALGIAKAQTHGVAIVGLRNSGHLGRIGDYAEMAAAADLVSLHFVNVAGSQLVAPFAGVDRRMSTNPIAIGVPVPGQPPIIHDFATSRVAEGKVLVAQNGGKPIPADSLIAQDGTVSGDPALLYGTIEPGTSPNPRNGPGALRTMGDHKGSGLAFLCEILAGALTGSGCAGPARPPVANGMLSVYFSGEFFSSGHDFATLAKDYIEFFQSSRPAEADGKVLLPGEQERRTRAEREANGIPLPENTWAAIRAAGSKVGLDAARIDQLIAG